MYLCFADLHFVVQWLDGCESPMYDTIQARDLVPPMEMDVLDVTEGVECQARFNQRFYRIRVIASGMERCMYCYALQVCVWGGGGLGMVEGGGENFIVTGTL